jgi:hypothetical protein
MTVLRSLVRVSVALAAVAFVGIAALWFLGPSACGNDFIKAVVSPDGTQKVVVFQRGCGATTGFSTQASLLPTGALLPNKSGNVFASDTNHDAAPSGPGGGPDIEVVWHDAQAVTISYRPSVRVFKAESLVGGVKFTYEAGVGVDETVVAP